MASDLFDKHEFDADVARHTSGAEFEAYKQREAEDEKYIRQQLARHTAEGDLNASGRMQRHMLDANAHGAGDNADFMKKWNELKEKTDKLRAAMRAAGKSTAEYDESIRQDVIAFLKAKGLSDEQIKEALAKNENPLDAVKPYLGGDKESRDLVETIRRSGGAEKSAKVQLSEAQKTQDQPLAIDVDAMNARLAAAGLDTPASSEPAGHGLTIQKPGKSTDSIVR
jgi:Pex14 N-terminal domain